MLSLPSSVEAYSVMTHEELIDLAWSGSIRPLLVARYPGLTELQLREAHAYAYGGCVIQDMGYYPFGNAFFSDLTHYVRTGDFISTLFRDAKNADELAFAVGALSHYIGDSIGHSLATNRATAVAFPKLEKEYGDSVTYDESPHAHVRTEFAFDIGRLAKHHFAPPDYLKHVGFQVPVKLLRQAFVETYGIPPKEIVGATHPALKSYERSVRSFIPAVSSAEVVLHGKQFPPDLGDPEDDLFVKRLSQTAFERDPRWRNNYGEPGFKAHTLAFVFRLLPKVGPLSMLAIKIPTVQTDDWYLHSVVHAVDELRRVLDGLHDGSTPKLNNLDLDTGTEARPGAYKLTDETYAKLLDELIGKHKATTIPAGLRENILAFYADPNAPNAVKSEPEKWQRVQSQLTALRTMRG